MNSVPAAEASLDRIIFLFFFLFHIQHYDELLKCFPHMHAYVQFPPHFQGVFWDHFPLKVVSWDENEASWTLGSGTP